MLYWGIHSQGGSMEIPERLEDWNYDTVVEVVSKHDYEPGRYDYKDVLTGTDPQKDKIRTFA